ncbi:hypothetical protein B0T22DRAFT_445803 [Podospora appendiculata]|uniref:Uncharacterized protein n=1 Tax=Podospora appendiculata TaxID=314037 RepID=A0AAE0WZ39_9PEZI|nr:hypothetical protein B0T22DRAFT_445803 [Podospora appendiculata]
MVPRGLFMLPRTLSRSPCQKCAPFLVKWKPWTASNGDFWDDMGLDRASIGFRQRPNGPELRRHSLAAEKRPVDGPQGICCTMRAQPWCRRLEMAVVHSILLGQLRPNGLAPDGAKEGTAQPLHTQLAIQNIGSISTLAWPCQARHLVLLEHKQQMVSPLHADDDGRVSGLSRLFLREGARQSINLDMCSWEQTLYACGHRGKLRRMKYSCTIYTRFIYGECRYDSRHDRVYDVISYDDCSDCRRLFEFVNL